MKTVAVDFDGVLHQYTGWKGEACFEGSYPWARELLTKLRDAGFSVVVYSTRDPVRIMEWLNERDLRHLVVSVSREKPMAVAYLDDRAVRFNPKDLDSVVKGCEEQPWWKEEGNGRADVACGSR